MLKKIGDDESIDRVYLPTDQARRLRKVGDLRHIDRLPRPVLQARILECLTVVIGFRPLRALIEPSRQQSNFFDRKRVATRWHFQIFIGAGNTTQQFALSCFPRHNHSTTVTASERKAFGIESQSTLLCLWAMALNAMLLQQWTNLGFEMNLIRETAVRYQNSRHSSDENLRRPARQRQEGSHNDSAPAFVIAYV